VFLNIQYEVILIFSAEINTVAAKPLSIMAIAKPVQGTLPHFLSLSFTQAHH
jgi:hypothetical protein